MKVKFILLSLFLFHLTNYQIHAQNLNLKDTTGVVTSFKLQVIRKISFDSGNIQIRNTDNSTNIHSLSSVRNLNFGDILTDIDAVIKTNKFVIYPSPVENQLFVKGLDFTSGIISILSIDGNVILVQNVYNLSNSILNLSGLSKGLYFCKYTNEHSSTVIRFIKQ